MTPTQRFRAALAPARRGDVPDDRELSATLTELSSAGRAAYPKVIVDDAELAAFIAARLSATATVREALVAAPAADLFLACAAIHGDRAARAAIEAMLDEVDIAGAAAAAARTEIEAVRGHLRHHLVTASDGPPLLDSYGGRGTLRGWLRVIAARELLRRRGMALPTPAATMMSTDASMDGIDTAHTMLDDVLRAALAELEPRERTLLRLNLLDRLDADRIGAIHGVGAGTARRWLEAARAAVVAAAQRQLAASPDRSSDDLGRTLRALRSQLDGRVERLLRRR